MDNDRARTNLGMGADRDSTYNGATAANVNVIPNDGGIARSESSPDSCIMTNNAMRSDYRGWIYHNPLCVIYGQRAFYPCLPRQFATEEPFHQNPIEYEQRKGKNSNQAAF
jgi:hypothetical protein